MANVSGTGLLDNLGVNVPDVTKLTAKTPISTQVKYLDQLAGKILEQAPWAVLKVGVGVGIIILGWIFTGWLAGRLNRLLVHTKMEATLAAFLTSTTRYVLFFNVFIVGITVIGVSSTSLAALLGAVGIAVGLGMRGTLASVTGGVMLIVHRPMKVGDWVETPASVGGAHGTVKRIGLFSTELNTPEMVRVFIPNALMWESVLRNDTYNRMRMVKVEFGLAGEANVREAFGKLRAMLTANPLVLKAPEPVLSIDRFDDKGIHCTLEAWVRTEDRKTLRQTILLEVAELLGKEGIRMAHQPVPVNDKADHKGAEDTGNEALKASASAAKDAKMTV